MAVHFDGTGVPGITIPPIAWTDTGTFNGFLLDSEYTYESGGDVVAVRFSSPVTQTSATMSFLVWCTAITGSPTLNAEVRLGSDTTEDDRPQASGATIGTPGSDQSPTANNWVKFTFTGLTLAADNVYYIIVKNTHLTPGSNNASICSQGKIRGRYKGGASTGGLNAQLVTSTNGFATDPSVPNYHATPFNITFDDGTYICNPYVDTLSVTASDFTGNRFVLAAGEQITTSGVLINIPGSSSVDGAIARIYEGATIRAEANGYRDHVNGPFSARWVPYTMVGPGTFDVVYEPAFGSGNHNCFDAAGGVGATVPTEVSDALIPFVTGVVNGTPGSFTFTANAVCTLPLIVDDLVTVSAGGGSSNSVRHANLRANTL